MKNEKVIKKTFKEMQRSKATRTADAIIGAIILLIGLLFVIYMIYILFFDPTSNLLESLIRPFAIFLETIVNHQNI